MVNENNAISNISRIANIDLQKYAWLISLLFAGIYALGWYIQFVNTYRLGVGVLNTSREAAVASGLILLLYALPLLFHKDPFNFAPAVRDEVKEKDDLSFWKKCFKFIKTNWAIYSFYYGYYYAISSICIESSFQRSEKLWFFLIYSCAALGYYSLRYSVAMLIHGNPIGIYQMICVFSLYTFFVAPYMQPAFGGYTLAPVHIISSMPDRSGKYIYVSSDTQFIILSKCSSPEVFWRSYANPTTYSSETIKMPMSEIKLIESEMPMGASGLFYKKGG